MPNSRLRVGVDFHVVDGKFQGSRTHVIELFARMAESAPEVDFFLFLDRPQELAGIDPAFGRPNVHAVRMPVCNPFARLYWHLPRLCRAYRLDIVHTQYVLPWPAACKRVVTIHDILFETHPQFFTRFFVMRSRLLMRLAARRADHVFTVSEFCKSEIARLYAVDPARITVTHNGVDTTRFNPHGDDHAVLYRRKLVRHGFLLSVGRLEPRKNHSTLVEAYATLPPDAPDLVLVGQRDFHFDAVFDAIGRLGLHDRVRVIEDIADDELPVLYRNALLFAYPAHAEGFGMPPLEAMASGTAVVTSNTTAIPEVVGDAALTVPPDDVATLSAAMQSLLCDPVERERRAAAGLARAALFTWKAPALRALERYATLVTRMMHPASIGKA